MIFDGLPDRNLGRARKIEVKSAQPRCTMTDPQRGDLAPNFGGARIRMRR
jgi:hypothetical protein